MDLGVRDRGYLIVGGTAGIGPAANALAREGARVAVVGRHPDRADTAAATISAHGGHTVAIVGDVTQRGGAERAVEQAVESLGDLVGMAVTTGTGPRCRGSEW